MARQLNKLIATAEGRGDRAMGAEIYRSIKNPMSMPLQNENVENGTNDGGSPMVGGW